MYLYVVFACGDRHPGARSRRGVPPALTIHLGPGTDTSLDFVIEESLPGQRSM